MKLVKWLKDEKCDYLELQSHPMVESRSTTLVRRAAFYHFKKYVIDRHIKNLMFLDAIVTFGSLFGLIFYISSGAVDVKDARTSYMIWVVGLHLCWLVLILVTYSVSDYLYRRRGVVVSIVCGDTDIPEWVIRLPEMCDSTEKSRCIILEVFNRSYVLPMETIDKITCDEQFQMYLTSI